MVSLLCACAFGFSFGASLIFSCKQICISNLNKGPMVNSQWIYNTPIHSDVEAKLRQLLVELGTADKVLGIQVCVSGCLIMWYFSKFHDDVDLSIFSFK